MNKLAEETSPYLQQHAKNPVHWYPWGEAALDAARDQNKPILLSIGYSACHWCHVMAHESFEDETTAALMNQHFINIKVDREERPDLDKIYQTAHSLLTNRAGGWPLTLFLTAFDHMPIFAGTYFPPQPRHGLPSFSQILEHIHHAYETRQDDIAKQCDAIREAYTRMDNQQQQSVTLNNIPLDIARNQIEKQFDSRYGGFSGAPKFPHPAIIDRALRHWAGTRHDSQRNHNSGDSRILHCALYTLKRMAAGGIFDQLGGGFCRYSTDEQWMIPHFEKMLYDNGPLLQLNAQAWCITQETCYLDAATDTADWVIREMQSPDGGYYSALDADSEGVEGKFYVWKPDQIHPLLDKELYPVFARRFGLNGEANFEGHWHLHAYIEYDKLADEFASELELSAEQLREQLRQAQQTLYNHRESRIHPGLDDKILTSWNGLMIAGMAQAGRMLNNPSYIESAHRAATFIKRRLWSKRRLLATCKGQRAHLNAYLDDYAFLLSGLLELLQGQWDDELLHWCVELADTLLDNFENKETGGFFFTSHDHEQLIQRSMTFNDEAMPSGNGLATSSLLRLGFLLGRTDYIESAERCLNAAWHSISQGAIQHCSLLNALAEQLKPPHIIIIRGDKTETRHWQQISNGHYLPNTLVFNIPPNASLPPSLEDKKTIGTVCAYPCEGMHCLPPITHENDFHAHIANRQKSLISTS